MFTQDLLLLLVYNKGVICVVDKGQAPVCKFVPLSGRRNTILQNNAIPSHDPYIPRPNPVFYNCTSPICTKFSLTSLTQITSPNFKLKQCSQQENEKQEVCDTIRYNHLNNADKLLLLSNNVLRKQFYLVDCVIYSNNERICHKKDKKSHSKVIDLGVIAKPTESSVLSQDEFLCEESGDPPLVHCDLNIYVPYASGLKLRESAILDKVTLKSDVYILQLYYQCQNDWCGYTGGVPKTRRYGYKDPGGSLYRCYYGKGQQICKKLFDKDELIPDEDRKVFDNGYRRRQ